MKLRNCCHIKKKGNFSRLYMWWALTILPSHVCCMCTVSPTARDSCFSVFAAKFHLTKKEKEKESMKVN